MSTKSPHSHHQQVKWSFPITLLAMVVVVMISGQPPFALSKAVIVDCNANHTRDYASLSEAIESKEREIIIKPCLYLMNSILKITYSNVIIRGDSPQNVSSIILRQTVQDDGIWIGNGAHNVSVSGLTLDGRSHNSRSMFTVGGGWNVTLENCIILGPKDMFSVYFAGPNNLVAGNATLMAFEEGNMDCYNRIRNCQIFSNWDGDVLSFSMQRYGLVENNKVVGGKIAFYMNRDSLCVNNTIVNSTSGGIEISLPSRDLFIAHNRILSPSGSGIKTVNEVEHPLLNPPLERNGNITIFRNVIKDGRFFGISIENVKDSTISHNSIYNTDLISIWVMRSDRLRINNNLIVNWGLEKIRGNLYQFNTHQCGIYMELSNKDHLVERNLLYAGSSCEKYGILSQTIFGRSVVDEQSNLLVQFNTLVGNVTAEWVELKGNSGISLNNTRYLDMLIQDENEQVVNNQTPNTPIPSPSPTPMDSLNPSPTTLNLQPSPSKSNQNHLVYNSTHFIANKSSTNLLHLSLFILCCIFIIVMQ